jgi:hypothetical protein
MIPGDGFDRDSKPSLSWSQKCSYIQNVQILVRAGDIGDPYITPFRRSADDKSCGSL